jgi:nuclear pore complex protein Nup53
MPGHSFHPNHCFFSPCLRKRATILDEDAPPTISVIDILRDVRAESGPSRFHFKVVMLTLLSTTNSLNHAFQPKHHTHRIVSTQAPPFLHVLVFGYPPDRYTLTVEFFKSLGESTEPEVKSEIVNCFKIGYKDPTNALRAMRRNGDVIGGSWMVGVKWAVCSLIVWLALMSTFQLLQDIAEAEASLGFPVWASASNPAFLGGDSVSHLSSTIGTQAKLVPSTSAFRSSASKDGSPHAGILDLANLGLSEGPQSSKGMLGQVSDLLFGW